MKTKIFNPNKISLYAPVLLLGILFCLASLRFPGFFNPAVITNLIDDNAFLGIAAVGMTFVIISGGIDLSVGSMVALTSILSVILIERFQLNPAVVFTMMLGLGLLCGAILGAIIAVFEIAPFLVTLAGMFFFRGMAYYFSQESIPLIHPGIQWFSSLKIPLGLAALPPTGFLFLLVVLAGIYLATWTGFGRSIFAVGGNPQSAKLMGLPVRRTTILIYALSGMLSALAGVVYTIYTSSGNATAAMGLELDVIAAVVIGGTLLSGGRGSVFGTMVGVFILGLIQTIITFEGTLSSWWSRIVIGVLLFFFVGLQKILSIIIKKK